MLPDYAADAHQKLDLKKLAHCSCQTQGSDGITSPRWAPRPMREAETTILVGVRPFVAETSDIVHDFGCVHAAWVYLLHLLAHLSFRLPFLEPVLLEEDIRTIVDAAGIARRGAFFTQKIVELFRLHFAIAGEALGNFSAKRRLRDVRLAEEGVDFTSYIVACVVHLDGLLTFSLKRYAADIKILALHATADLFARRCLETLQLALAEEAVSGVEDVATVTDVRADLLHESLVRGRRAADGRLKFADLHVAALYKVADLAADLVGRVFAKVEARVIVVNLGQSLAVFDGVRLAFFVSRRGRGRRWVEVRGGRSVHRASCSHRDRRMGYRSWSGCCSYRLVCRRDLVV